LAGKFDGQCACDLPCSRIAGLLELQPFSFTPKQPANIQIISVPGHKIVREWKWAPDALIGGTAFGDSCAVVCAGQPAAQANQQGHAACWSIQTGEKTAKIWTSCSILRSIRLSPSVKIGSPHPYTKSGASREVFGGIRYGGCFTASKRRVVWNVRTGQEALSWGLSEQKFQMGRPDGRLLSQPFAVALSAKHEFLSEGGDGRVQIYAIP
jgi:hypothetical protein